MLAIYKLLRLCLTMELVHERSGNITTLEHNMATLMRRAFIADKKPKAKIDLKAKSIF